MLRHNPFMVDGKDEDEFLHGPLQTLEFNGDYHANHMVKNINAAGVTDVTQAVVTDEETASDYVSLDVIAARLIKERCILTALELHLELIESGRELTLLRDFFSNPSNWEEQRTNESLRRSRTSAGHIIASNITRTSSLQTFEPHDSSWIDVTRYSIDSARVESDRLAVLEFELRTAKSTINSLRAALTRCVEPDTVTAPTKELNEVDVGPGRGSESAGYIVAEEPIHHYERRAINFLIHEHLLRFGYKLTAVTLSEECEEGQDYETWDDVGLNFVKPPELIRLYRDHVNFTTRGDLNDVDRNDKINEDSFNKSTVFMRSGDYRRNGRFCLLKSDIEKNAISETQHSNPLSKEKHITNESYSKSNYNLRRHSVIVLSNISERNRFCRAFSSGDNETRAESTVDGVISCEMDSRPTLNATALNATRQATQNLQESNSLSDDIKKTKERCEECVGWVPTERPTSLLFQRALLDKARGPVINNDGIACDILQLCSDDIVSTLGSCLPRIVPSVLLACREELIPLIVVAATLHSQTKTRDELLCLLFNLIKRPDSEQRRVILDGCAVFARNVGASRLESELLPQAWEQITHRHIERRLLVAEACGVLAPYITDEMRGSLVLSILTQMMEDKEEEVREAVIHSLAVLCAFISDADKYATSVQLVFNTLNDESEKVICVALDVLLPSVAVWAIELDCLETHLIQTVLDNLTAIINNVAENKVNPTPARGGGGRGGGGGGGGDGGGGLIIISDQNRLDLYVTVLQRFVPFLYLYVIMKTPSVESTDTSVKEAARVSCRYSGERSCGEIPERMQDIFDVSVVAGGEELFKMYFERFHRYVSVEEFEPWTAYSWISDEFLPKLSDIIISLDPTQPSISSLSLLFQHICQTFGRTFTTSKIVPLFNITHVTPRDPVDRISTDNIDQTLNQATVQSAKSSVVNQIVVSPNRGSLAVIYATGVLTAFVNHEQQHDQLRSFLWDCILEGVSAQTTHVRIIFVELSKLSRCVDLLIALLWDAVLNLSPAVRFAAARLFEAVVPGVVACGSRDLMSRRVFPALVSLLGDAEIRVRIATVAALGAVAETVIDHAVLEKVYMQFQTVVDDPLYLTVGPDSTAMYVELIRTFGRIGPASEPLYRDDFILPHLTVLAARNRTTADKSRRKEVAQQLLEAFSALFCCFISDRLQQEVMLPGLRFLLADLKTVAPHSAVAVESMICEVEDRIREVMPSSGSSSINDGKNKSDAGKDKKK